MKIEIFSATDTGKIRDHNEDSLLALGGDSAPPNFNAVLVIADGMGGHAAGEVASQITVDGIMQLLSNRSSETACIGGAKLEDFLINLLSEINQDVWTLGRNPENRDMGTTCTFAGIRNNRMSIAHIGDSRAYLYRNSYLTQITTDHSWVEEAIVGNRLSREEARVHPNRNVITRAIGISPECLIDTFTIPLLEGDLILLCSDGLNSMLPDQDIQGILETHPFSEICNVLVEQSNAAGGHDNTSVVAAYLTSTEDEASDKRHDEITQKIYMSNAWWIKLIRKVVPKR